MGVKWTLWLVRAGDQLRTCLRTISLNWTYSEEGTLPHLGSSSMVIADAVQVVKLNMPGKRGMQHSDVRHEGADPRC